MSLLDTLRRRPQTLWIRRAAFQVHLWAGLAIGLYVVAISLSGSVLVYRSELRQQFDPQPRVVAVGPERLSMEALTEQVEAAYPDVAVEVWTDPEDPTHAVTMQIGTGDARHQRLFDPYTAADLGHALPFGWRATTWLLDLHDNLLGGETGRTVNGVGAVLLSLVAVSGAIVWWPGVATWRRSLVFDRRAGWRRFNWTLHSAAGFWTLLFIVMWGLTGIYLAFPGPFTAFVDYVEPLDLETFAPRTGDAVLYWFSAVHFGRFGGHGTKALWAALGLVPVVMVLTSVVMWWTRVVRRRLRADHSSVGRLHTNVAPD